MQNIGEAIGDIPVGIGTQDLKHTIPIALLPSWCCWSHDTLLHIDNVKLCFKKDWLKIALRFGQPIDQDAIRSHFFKVKKDAGGVLNLQHLQWAWVSICILSCQIRSLRKLKMLGQEPAWDSAQMLINLEKEIIYPVWHLALPVRQLSWCWLPILLTAKSVNRDHQL